MGEEEIELIYAPGCFLFAQLSRVRCMLFVSYASIFPCVQDVCLRFQEMADVMKSEHALRNLGMRMVDWVVLLVNYVPFQ
jgi:hypothetical protein